LKFSLARIEHWVLRLQGYKTL